MSRENARTIDDLGRVTIPESLRMVLGWEPGDEIALCIDVDNGTIELELDRKGGEVKRERKLKTFKNRG